MSEPPSLKKGKILHSASGSLKQQNVLLVLSALEAQYDNRNEILSSSGVCFEREGPNGLPP